MEKVLIIIPYYFPGYRSGGPQQTIRNVVETYGRDVDIYIYTQNHDLGVSNSYDDIQENIWEKRYGANIMYVSDAEYVKFKNIKNLYYKFDKIYACGLFELVTIQLLLVHRIINKLNKYIYIAPMGVFSDGAIRSKFLKKKLFLVLFNNLGIFKNINWSLTSELEREDIYKHIKKKYLSKYVIAEDLPRKIDFEKMISKLKNYQKDEKSLHIIFLSRICDKKNLEYCLDILKDIKDLQIIFDIYGTIEDDRYWQLCKRKIDLLPHSIKTSYKGEVKPEYIEDVFSKYDVFLFPTKGENYGHVIYESLASGCIPVISDTTPWKNLDDNQCGNVIKLNRIDLFQKKLITYINMRNNEIKVYKENAINYARNKYIESITDSGYKKILEVK